MIGRKEKRLVAFVWIVGLIIFWEIIAFILQEIIKDPLASTKLPYLHSIIITFIEKGDMLIKAGAVTFSRALLGLAYGTMAGFILAIIMSLSRVVERITFPYLIVSQMIPVLGLAPIIFNIVRDMDTSRIVIAAYITFFPVSVNMLSGLRSVEGEKKELLYSIATRKHLVYFKLMLPYSIPYLFNGLKIAAPMAVTASILVDMLGSSGGIGVKLLYSLYSGTTEIFWASVLTSALMGILSYYLVIFVQYMFIPWKNPLLKRKRVKIQYEE